LEPQLIAFVCAAAGAMIAKAATKHVVAGKVAYRTTREPLIRSHSVEITAANSRETRILMLSLFKCPILQIIPTSSERARLRWPGVWDTAHESAEHPHPAEPGELASCDAHERLAMPFI
jgi:hypothetical protein